ncbi:MAG: hypothetical protein COA90_01050 [Gammaproteobacteria bacterium]|nr:MAG: hypothetical protein COA90_01050 [Gammaproteobacteria bacterium]
MILTTQAKRKTSSADDSLIPLINVVFLMLIFFMVAGHIEPSDGVNVSPPVSLSASDITAEPLKIVVGKEGQVFIASVLISDGELTQQVLAYSSLMAEGQQASVIVKADAELAIEQLQRVFKDIKAAGIERLSLITSQTQV